MTRRARAPRPSASPSTGKAALVPQPSCGPAKPPARPTAALRQVCILYDELDIFVGELSDPNRGLVGVRHLARASLPPGLPLPLCRRYRKLDCAALATSAQMWRSATCLSEAGIAPGQRFLTCLLQNAPGSTISQPSPAADNVSLCSSGYP